MKKLVGKLPYTLRRVKWFWQRGVRGYSDNYAWDIRSHIASVLLGSLTVMRDHLNGYPGDLTVDEGEGDPDWEFAAWVAVLTAMIDGFQAIIDLDSHNYLAGAPVPNFEGNLKDDPFWTWCDEHDADIRIIEKELHGRGEVALDLFKEYYWNLWD